MHGYCYLIQLSYSYSSRNGVSLRFKMAIKGNDDKGTNWLYTKAVNYWLQCDYLLKTEVQISEFLLIFFLMAQWTV